MARAASSTKIRCVRFLHYRPAVRLERGAAIANEPSTFALRTRAATPRDQRRDICDDVVPGLILRVYRSGARCTRKHGPRATVLRDHRQRRCHDHPRSPARGPEADCELHHTKPVSRDCGPRTPGYPMTTFGEEFLDRQAARWKPTTQASNPLLLLGHALVETTAS